MLKDEVIRSITCRLTGVVDSKLLQDILYVELNNYDIVETTKNEVVEYNQSENQRAYQMFFISKKVEGCTDKTIKYYGDVLGMFTRTIVKPFTKITTNDLRYYLAMRSTQDKISKVTQDNERRILSSFFVWLTANEYIDKNPMLPIKAIKKEKRIKKPFSEDELELIRNAYRTEKEAAVVEFLYSTGCRAGELVDLRIEDLDLNSGKVLVFGKGEKEREVFVGAKCKLALKQYLSSRGNPTSGPLFHSSRGGALKYAGIEEIIKKVGKRAGVENCHPHRFRRTTATTALNRGMPLEQVQMMLGHENIATTTIYAISDKASLQYNHKRYVV